MKFSSILSMDINFVPYNGSTQRHPGETGPRAMKIRSFFMDATQVSTQEEIQLPQEPGKKGPLFPVPRKKKKWIKRGAILLVVLLAIWWFFLRPSGGGGGVSAAGQYIPVPASLQDLTVAVDGSGAVTPIESYQVGALVSGEVLAAPFEVGDWIEKGDLLYQLDAGDAEIGLQQAQLSLRQAQLNYDELLSGMSPSASAAGVVQQVHVQKGDLVSPGTPIADVADNSTMTLTLPFQSADASSLSPGQGAQVTIAGTMEVLSGTVESISSAELVGNGGALVRQVKIRVDNPGALTSANSATATVGDIACAGSGSFEENTRQTVVAQTSGEVTAVHVTAGSRVSAGTALVTLGGDGAQSALENSAISVENAQLALQRAQDALESYTITAPISGTIIEKNYKVGDKVDGMDAGSLAILYDMSSLKLTMNISELDLNQVQEGQEVDITAEALPGQVFQGVVDRVSINGTTTNGFTTYPVTILLREFGDLNPGMNVSADIVVERTTGVLCVPVSAVNSDGTVLVAGPGTLSEDGLAIANLSKAERRPVELGRSNEEYIEITSGLSQDEVVLVPDQATGSMGAVAMGG